MVTNFRVNNTIILRQYNIGSIHPEYEVKINNEIYTINHIVYDFDAGEINVYLN